MSQRQQLPLDVEGPKQDIWGNNGDAGKPLLGQKVLDVPGHEVIDLASQGRGHHGVVIQVLEPNIVVAA